METQVIQGHRPSNMAAAAGKKPSDSINIGLSAPKYSVFDEEKGVHIYPAEAPRMRRFESEITGLRIQLRSVLPQKMDSGGWIPGREFYIQFKSSKFRTNKVDEIVAIENCSDYGVKIWDVDALVGVAKQARIKAAVKAAEEDPEILEALKVNFGMKDFIEALEPTEGSDSPETPYQGGAYTPMKGKDKKKE